MHGLVCEPLTGNSQLVNCKCNTNGWTGLWATNRVFTVHNYWNANAIPKNGLTCEPLADCFWLLVLLMQIQWMDWLASYYRMSKKFWTLHQFKVILKPNLMIIIYTKITKVIKDYTIHNLKIEWIYKFQFSWIMYCNHGAVPTIKSSLLWESDTEVGMQKCKDNSYFQPITFRNLGIFLAFATNYSILFTMQADVLDH